MHPEMGAEKCKWLTGPSLMHNYSPAEPQAHHSPIPTTRASADGAATLHQRKHVTPRAWTLCHASGAGMLWGKKMKGQVTWISALKILNGDTGTQSQTLFSVLTPKSHLDASPSVLLLVLLHLMEGRPHQSFHRLSPFISQAPYLHTWLEKDCISQNTWSVLPWYLRVAFKNRCCKHRAAPALTLVPDACQAAAQSKLYPA